MSSNMGTFCHAESRCGMSWTTPFTPAGRVKIATNIRNIRWPWLGRASYGCKKVVHLWDMHNAQRVGKVAETWPVEYCRVKGEVHWWESHYLAVGLDQEEQKSNGRYRRYCSEGSEKRSESYQSHFDRLSSEKYCQFQHLQASIRLHPLPLVLSCAVPWFGTLDLDHITDCCHGGGGRTGAECQVGTEPAPKTNSIQIPFSMLKKWEHQKTVKKICVKHFKPHFECKTTWDLAAGAVSLS